MRNIAALEKAGFLVLRIGLALIFIWFGYQQLSHADMWTSYVPAWASGSFLDAHQLVLMNGLFEIVAAVLLIFGVFVRTVALLLALHLVGIALSIGLNPVGVRDLGLAFATTALALIGKGGASKGVR